MSPLRVAKSSGPEAAAVFAARRAPRLSDASVYFIYQLIPSASSPKINQVNLDERRISRDANGQCAQKEAAMLQIGQTAPDFTAETTQGPIRFHEWLGDSWGVLFSHPKDFTPVCTTELGFTAKLKDQFRKRGVKVIALSVDSAESHLRWIEDIDATQNTTVDFPILVDTDRKVSELYDLVHPNASATATVRSLFVIDPYKKIRLTITYPASTGRNFDEVLRVIDSLQLTDTHSVATPANWKQGDDVVILPSLQDSEVIGKKFPQGYVAVKPYLRITPQPNVYKDLSG
jgi:alkyl hydroperoxide reductase subunit AhpC